MGWMWNNGPCNSCHVGFASKLGGITSGCSKCLSFYITKNHFSRIVVFHQYLGSIFPICPMILCIPILTIFFTSFLTWGSHYNFVSIWYTIRDPFGGALFALAHLRVVHLITTTHATCVFPSLIDDTHIVGPISNVVPTFLQLHAELTTLRFCTQPTKSVVWFP